jgi:hypothetical protein
VYYTTTNSLRTKIQTNPLLHKQINPIASATILYSFSSAAASDTCQDLSAAYPNDIPWVSYQGDEYIFTRQKYNSVCVDSHGQQFEYGTIIGEYPPIDTAGGGCSTACVKGVSVDMAKGCNQRPPSNRLVGFQYDCERATCKCLYEAGTLSNQYERCFDDMNLSNQGNGQVHGTKPQQGETCYSLYIQQDNTPPPPGADYCTDAPDYSCYSSGRPSCCNEPGGSTNCPANQPACDVPTPPSPVPLEPLGADYCTYAPDYSCYSSGRPSCCNEPGGSTNCPVNQPACDVPTPPGPPGPPGPKAKGAPTKTGFESYRQDMKPSMKGAAKGARSAPQTGFQNYRQVNVSSMKGAAPEAVRSYTYVAKKRGLDGAGSSKFYEHRSTLETTNLKVYLNI